MEQLAVSGSELVDVAVAEGIARVRMQDVEGRNALSPAMVTALVEALDEVGRDEDVRVVTLSGTKEYFSTGASRDVLESLAGGGIAATDLVLSMRLLDLPVPVVGVAEGSAIGGGFVLLCAADMVMIARESRYGANFMGLGITPGMGATRLLEATLSHAVAHELLYAADLRTGASLESRSGFNAVLPRTELAAHAEALAWTIAGQRRENLRLLKRTLTLPRRKALLEAFHMESLMHETSLDRLETTELEPAPTPVRQ